MNQVPLAARPTEAPVPSRVAEPRIPGGAQGGGMAPGAPGFISGQLLRVNGGRHVSVTADGLNQPTSFEIIHNTAYVVTLGGEIWTIPAIT